jgi:hypothetical protein
MQTLAMNQLTGEDTGKYRINRLLGQGPVSSFYEASSVSGKNVMLTAFYLPADWRCIGWIETSSYIAGRGLWPI